MLDLWWGSVGGAGWRHYWKDVQAKLEERVGIGQLAFFENLKLPFTPEFL